MSMSEGGTPKNAGMCTPVQHARYRVPARGDDSKKVMVDVLAQNIPTAVVQCH